MKIKTAKCVEVAILNNAGRKIGTFTGEVWWEKDMSMVSSIQGTGTYFSKKEMPELRFLGVDEKADGSGVYCLFSLIHTAGSCDYCGKNISKERMYKPEWADKACGICVACENEALANS